MSAKYQIKISDLSGVTDTFLNIPINLTPQMTDQAELVDRKFVDVEIEKAINPIQDYEKARFSPIYFPDPTDLTTHKEIDTIVYNVRFLNSTNFPTGPTMYSEIGMSNDDIKFGKKRFENSFLNLSFYDSDRATDQRLLSIINVFPRITGSEIQLTGPSAGLPKPANQIPVTFMLNDPIEYPDGFAEGFYIYNFKDEVTAELPKELYMRGRFNNASDGSVTNMMTDGVPYFIDDLVHKLYTRYVLYRNNTGYFYALDETYSNNVTRVGNSLTIDIYEIQAL